jgi:hypothetical protein
MWRISSLPEHILESSRTLSFTDAEYEKLGMLADAVRLGRSENIIEKLGLAK